jgi:hypothetical protein
MNQLDPLAHWQRVYERPEQAVSWYQPTATTSLELIQRATLSPHSPIIDVGGGASTLVDGLVDQGYADVTVLDISARALGASCWRLGARAELVHWLLADITSWRCPRPYACWHDRAVLHFFTDPNDRAAYLRALAEATTPGAAIIIGTFAEDGPERCSGLPVVRYSIEALEELLGPVAELEEATQRTHTTPSGASQAFTWTRFSRVR